MLQVFFQSFLDLGGVGGASGFFDELASRRDAGKRQLVSFTKVVRLRNIPSAIVSHVESRL